MNKSEALGVSHQQILRETQHEHQVLVREASAPACHSAPQSLEEGGYQLGSENGRSQRQIEQSQESALFKHAKD